MRNPVGTIVDLWFWGEDGAGYGGKWLVGTKTVWSVEQAVSGSAVKAPHPSRIYTDIVRHTVVGKFADLPPGSKVQVYALLGRKRAEKGRLSRALLREDSCSASTDGPCYSPSPAMS